MTPYLVAWVGNTDLAAAQGKAGVGLGPIAQGAVAGNYVQTVLLSDHGKLATTQYVEWLQSKVRGRVVAHHVRLTSPTNFGEIYEAATDVLDGIAASTSGTADLTFHLSPGTPAMAAVWVILAKTRFPATLIESSRDHGVKVASVPFDISADYLPQLLRRPDERLVRLTQGLPDEAPAFDAIIHRCDMMKEVIARARRVAVRSLPVLIEGESGTGKELLARAIHRASPRHSQPFIAVNCGAIPPDLVESEFFGHKKGAFTGASLDRQGHFERANCGTLFLDEVGELPKLVQVKLLRVLELGEVVRVGESEPRKVDVRIISATNRNLAEEIRRGAFREDLFYRLAVALVRLPPLRHRQGDLGHLIDVLLDRVNAEAVGEPGFRPKKLAARAKAALMRHSWPGNVRELQNTLRRAVVWSGRDEIDVEAVQESILTLPSPVASETVLGRSVEDGLNLQELLGDVARHYLKRALEVSGGNKTAAAEMLGFKSYQTFSNWAARHGVL